MQTQYINEMLDLPELQIRQILPISAEELHIEVTPVAQKQCCPICRSEEFIILKGSNGMRKVRHLPAFEKKVYLLLSSIRMQYSKCESGFVWDYLCVGPKKRYNHLFRERAAEQALGSTAAHSARMQQAPTTTVQQMHNEFVPQECERHAEQVWKQAKESGGLVLGVDDFAIKKGHTYNTGIHDLKGEMMLDLLPGESWKIYELMRRFIQTFCYWHLKQSLWI
jgi:transposase